MQSRRIRKKPRSRGGGVFWPQRLQVWQNMPRDLRFLHQVPCQVMTEPVPQSIVYSRLPARSAGWACVHDFLVVVDRERDFRGGRTRTPNFRLRHKYSPPSSPPRHDDMHYISMPRTKFRHHSGTLIRVSTLCFVGTFPWLMSKTKRCPRISRG